MGVMCSDNVIEDALRTLLEHLRRHAPNIDQWDPTQLSLTLMREADRPGSLISQFCEQISVDGSFGLLRGGWLDWGRGGRLIQPNSLAFRLIAWGLNGSDISEEISELRSFAHSKTRPLVNYYAVAGISVSKTVEIAESIRLIPWSNLRESTQKILFGPRNEAIFDERHFVFFRQEATCALQVDQNANVALYESHSDAKLSPEEQAKQFKKGLEDGEKAWDVLRIAFLLNPNGSNIVGSWEECSSPTIQRLYGSSYSYNGSLLGINFTSVTDIYRHRTAIAKLYKDFSSLSKETMRENLRHSLDRLRLAMQRPSYVDRAIDLGIALEMMILHDLGEKSELRYRLAMRAAAFLYRNQTRRVETFKLFKNLYDLRSQAVHGGRLGKWEAKAPDLLESGVRAAAKIAKKLISLGDYPTWEDDIILGRGAKGVR